MTTTTIQLNQGMALLHLAGLYPSLQDVILEQVQNALDSDVRATRVSVTLNYKTRHLSVRDNGQGVSMKKFNEALASVATPGRKGENSLGQFGVGLISPFGKCDWFTFVSCPTPHTNSFQEWTFVTNDIIGQSDNLNIPVRHRPDLTLSEKLQRGQTKVEWRSEMQLFGITTDKAVSEMTMEGLIGSILDRYGLTMYKNKVAISVTFIDVDGVETTKSNITASGYKGEPLEEYVYRDKETDGQVTIRLFLARKTPKGRVGKVHMGVEGSDFRFPFHLFARSTDGLLDGEVIDALKSGLFEGEITTQKGNLHASRRTFVRDDHFLTLCTAIEQWFTEVGKKCQTDLKRELQTQRLQELGLASMSVIEHLVNDPRFEALLRVIKGFHFGNIGCGHTGLPIRGEQDHTAIALHGTEARGRPKKDKGEGREEPEHENLEHHPFTVAGDRGERRKLVRRTSFGLQFSHEAMPGSPRLWELDCEQGILTFNIRHPLWTACDEKSDAAVMRLQEHVTIQALILYSQPETLRVAQRQVLDAAMSPFVSLLIEGDRIRSLGRKSRTPPEE
jgi:hypothetical protein